MSALHLGKDAGFNIQAHRECRHETVDRMRVEDRLNGRPVDLLRHNNLVSWCLNATRGLAKKENGKKKNTIICYQVSYCKLGRTLDKYD